MVSNISSPLPNVFKIGEDILEWIENLDDYFLACFVTEPADKNKIASLRRAIGSEHVKTVKELQAELPEDDRQKYAELRKAVVKHYEKKTSVIIERHTFNTITQEEGELIDAFVNRLKIQATKCQFKVASVNSPTVTYRDLTDEFIRDRVVVGLHDGRTRSRLLRERDLTLVTAMDIVRSVEMANAEVKQLLLNSSASNPGNSVSIHGMKSKKKNSGLNRTHKPQIRYGNGIKTHRTGPGNGGQMRNNILYECSYCGRQHERGKCKAFGKKCNKCSVMNHFAAVCKTNQRNVAMLESGGNYEQYDVVYEDDYTADTKEMYDQYEDVDDQLFLGLITVSVPSLYNLNNFSENVKQNCEISQINMKDWIETLKIDKAHISVKIDTGAQANVISDRVLKYIDPKYEICISEIELSAYGGNKIPTLGYVNLNCTLDETSLPVKFIVVPLRVRTVLGLESSIRFGLVSPRRHLKGSTVSVTRKSSVEPPGKSAVNVNVREHVTHSTHNTQVTKTPNPSIVKKGQVDKTRQHTKYEIKPHLDNKTTQCTDDMTTPVKEVRIMMVIVIPGQV